VRLALREAILAFRRSPLLSVLGVTTIAFSLFAFLLFSLVALNIRTALRSVEERVEVRAFLVDNTPVDSIATMMEELGKRPDVMRVEYIDKDQALVRAREELGEFRNKVSAQWQMSDAMPDDYESDSFLPVVSGANRITSMPTAYTRLMMLPAWR